MASSDLLFCCSCWQCAMLANAVGIGGGPLFVPILATIVGMGAMHSAATLDLSALKTHCASKGVIEGVPLQCCFG
jgi:uncharacterized membrane protein YfcA